MRDIRLATVRDTEDILALYRTMLYGAADWDEDYPSVETIEFDIGRDALFVMEDCEGIVAVISIDEDSEVEALDCWSNELTPVAELSRLCVRGDMQGKGIARIMMKHMFDILREQGHKGVHILVREGHNVAFASYEALGFKRVGRCNLFDKDFVCMEIGI